MISRTASEGRRVIDSSGWIEYFIDGPNAGAFAPAIKEPNSLVVPSLVLTEVFRWILRKRDENTALRAAGVMQQGDIVPLDEPIALQAARLGLEHRLPLADSVIYATARAQGALLLTQDADFEGLPAVELVRHRRS